MMFTVVLSHVITISTARVQGSFQLRLCSNCPLLALTHAGRLVKVICFSDMVQWLHFTGEVDTFITFCLKYNEDLTSGIDILRKL